MFTLDNTDILSFLVIAGALLIYTVAVFVLGTLFGHKLFNDAMMIGKQLGDEAHQKGLQLARAVNDVTEAKTIKGFFGGQLPSIPTGFPQMNMTNGSPDVNTEATPKLATGPLSTPAEDGQTPVDTPAESAAQ